MYKKKLNILLIPLALTVWIIILLRVFSITNHSIDHNNSRPRPIVSESSSNSYDTLNLLLNYRDPFEQGNISIKIDESSFKGNKQSINPQQIKPPSIRYLGLIEQGNKVTFIGLTFIDDHSYLISVGDTVKGLRIIHIYHDSILLDFHKKLLRIDKTQKIKV